MVFHCFNLQFPNDIWCRAFFRVCILFVICISSLVKCLFRSSDHILIGLLIFSFLSFWSCLYSLITVLYQIMCFRNIFSQPVLLILLTLPFTKQKFLILMKSNLSIVSFMNCAFGVISNKSLPYLKSSRFSSMFSSRSFKVLHFIFRPLIHFELIFVKHVKICV